ncbi:hypothetical protein Bbelb_187960 [Branchiostoma belcheri]|nr:hypothetical protein Bbelb_187960 [Branchiostoma belcheri]
MAGFELGTFWSDLTRDCFCVTQWQRRCQEMSLPTAQLAIRVASDVVVVERSAMTRGDPGSIPSCTRDMSGQGKALYTTFLTPPRCEWVANFGWGKPYYVGSFGVAGKLVVYGYCCQLVDGQCSANLQLNTSQHQPTFVWRCRIVADLAGHQPTTADFAPTYGTRSVACQDSNPGPLDSESNTLRLRHTTPQGTAQEEDCLDGWTAYRGACFKLFTETATMGSANNFCQSLGGSNVLRPKTKGIQALVQGMIMDHPEASYWMHMIRSPMIEGGWTYLDSTWLIDCDFTNWGPASDGEVSSNDGANTEQCAILTPDTNWQWEDTSCGNTYSYICQKVLVNDPCPSGWTVGPGHYCYKVSATVATFAGAESVCAAEQARLAAPYDERTHQFIVGMGMLVNPNSDHWVGIKPDTVNGGFKFSDDTDTCRPGSGDSREQSDLI